MNAAIYIEPHERSEAIEAYRDRLNAEQINEIYDAPDSAIIRLDFGLGAPGVTVQVIEEG